ncbi:ankyrin repeat domain-containing protein, partial [Lysobacter sp.]|uniref:ankyrin repeat domain-containing protein n=1 Tax=Lysobacter sp. TaxID=72226 RepID=UPI002D41D275
MPEPTASRAPNPLPWRLGAVLAGGVVLGLLGGLGGVIAAIAVTLAQPVSALAVRAWRDGGLPPRREAQRDLASLAMSWVGVVAVMAAVIAWPLSSLRETGSLSAALGLSAMLGIVLLALWRLWPLWLGLERDGGPLREHWHALGELELGAWRGLGVAAIVLGVAVAALALAWPDLLGTGARWTLAAVLAVGAPALHAVLQMVEPADALPGFAFDEVEDEEEEPTALVEGEPLAPALYAAARAGRVERALELIELGADVTAPPPADDRDQRSLSVLAAVLPDLRLLRALIANGIDLNATHAGMTPLLAATRDSWHGRPDAVMTLLANGADPRLTDGEGNTPLHHAARSSDPGVAALLRDAAAELDPLNRDGLSPLGVACAVGNWRLAKFLLERGAKPEPAGGQPALLA